MKFILSTAACMFALCTPLLSGCTAAPAFDGPETVNYDGIRFVNREPMDKSAGDFVKLAWGALTEASPWPVWVETATESIPLTRVYQGISVTFINHATFLLQVDGLNILTDPIYSDRASPYQWVGPKRVHAPGIPLEQLPPIDLVLISHNHYDHLDEATLLQLAARQEQPPMILAGLGNGLLFSELGLHDHRDMDWQDTIRVGEVEVVFTECRHRSGRGLADQMKTLWGSFVLKTSAGNIYFAGDTGYGPHLRETGEQFGPFALALLPIGAYQPRWFMADVHLDPEEAVRAHLDLRSEHSIGMQFGNIQLTYEGIDDPVLDLGAALDHYGLEIGAFDVLEVGQTSFTGFRLHTADSQRTSRDEFPGGQIPQ
jgi:L-ascorbate metabolism protein UlaG (beta-lactamase superfamily)